MKQRMSLHQGLTFVSSSTSQNSWVRARWHTPVIPTLGKRKEKDLPPSPQQYRNVEAGLHYLGKGERDKGKEKKNYLSVSFRWPGFLKLFVWRTSVLAFTPDFYSRSRLDNSTTWLLLFLPSCTACPVLSEALLHQLSLGHSFTSLSVTFSLFYERKPWLTWGHEDYMLNGRATALP